MRTDQWSMIDHREPGVAAQVHELTARTCRSKDRVWKPEKFELYSFYIF